MVCENPRYIYLRKSYPIKKPDEETLHRLNKPKFTYQSSKNYYQIQIPCGQCLGCKLDHANEWATRIYCEQKQWKNNCVVMLSYNDPHLHFAKNGKTTLKKKDVQDFFKRLLKNEKGIQEWINPQTLKQERPIRRFYCGEYGMNGTRAKSGGNPHYHAAIFNWTPNDLKFYKMSKTGYPMYKSKSLQKLWGHGLVVVQPLTYENACYIARYVQKKAGIAPKPRKYEQYQDIYGNWQKKIIKDKTIPEDEFIEMSTAPGIGRQYWEENKEKLKKQNGIYILIKDKVKLKKLPRYFKKCWEKENFEEYHNARYKNIINAKELMKELINQIDININDCKAINDDYKENILRQWQTDVIHRNAGKLKREAF